MRRCWLILLRCVLLLAAAGVVAPAAHGRALSVPLETGSQTIDVRNHIQYLIEEQGEALTPAAASDTASPGRWQTNAGRHLYLGRKAVPVWVRLTVANPSPHHADWTVRIGSPLIQSARIYTRVAGTTEWIAGDESGSTVPSHLRPLKAPVPLLPFSAKPHAQSELLIRIDSDAALTLPISIWEKSALERYRHDQAVLIGLLLGAIAVMVLYNASLALFTHEARYRTYTAYLVTVLLYELAATGYGPLYLWGAFPLLTLRAYECFACLSFLAACVFAREFLDLARAPAHINWASRVLMALWTVLAALAPFVVSPLFGMSMAAAALVTNVVAMYTAIRLSAQGDTSARQFFLAWSLLLIGTFVRLFCLAGWIDSNAWTESAQHVGFLLEIVLLSVALAHRIRRARLAQTAATAERLRLAEAVHLERQKRIEAQDAALAAQRRMTAELERRVDERTVALLNTMRKLEDANRQLAELSTTDALTGLPNRRRFDEQVAEEFGRAQRNGSMVAVFMVDVDHFKNVNDEHGHPAGDQCLQLVADTLRQAAGRAADIVARYGGEEFVVLAHCTDEAGANALAERMRAEVARLDFIRAGLRVPVTVSVGLHTTVPRANQAHEAALRQADVALYLAKRLGRNRVAAA